MTLNTDQIKEGTFSDGEIQQKESMATIASMMSTELDYRQPIHIQQIYKYESEKNNLRKSSERVERPQELCIRTFHNDRKRSSIQKTINRPEMNATRITLT